jgi:hypothetical protein
MHAQRAVHIFLIHNIRVKTGFYHDVRQIHFLSGVRYMDGAKLDVNILPTLHHSNIEGNVSSHSNVHSSPGRQVQRRTMRCSARDPSVRIA